MQNIGAGKVRAESFIGYLVAKFRSIFVKGWSSWRHQSYAKSSVTAKWRPSMGFVQTWRSSASHHSPKGCSGTICVVIRNDRGDADRRRFPRGGNGEAHGLAGQEDVAELLVTVRRNTVAGRGEAANHIDERRKLRLGFVKDDLMLALAQAEDIFRNRLLAADRGQQARRAVLDPARDAHGLRGRVGQRGLCEEGLRSLKSRSRVDAVVTTWIV